MATPAERMKAMRHRRRSHGLREIRLLVPDVRAEAIRRRIAAQAAGLPTAAEQEALDWIEQVAEFDAPR